MSLKNMASFQCTISINNTNFLANRKMWEERSVEYCVGGKTGIQSGEGKIMLDLCSSTQGNCY
jgi:hypothetical protein